MADLHNLTLTPPATGARNTTAAAAATAAAATQNAPAPVPPTAPAPAGAQAPGAAAAAATTSAGPAHEAPAATGAASDDVPDATALDAAHYQACAEALERIVAALPSPTGAAGWNTSSDTHSPGGFGAVPAKDARRVILPPAIPGFKSNALDNSEFNFIPTCLYLAAPLVSYALLGPGLPCPPCCASQPACLPP